MRHPCFFLAMRFHGGWTVHHYSLVSGRAPVRQLTLDRFGNWLSRVDALSNVYTTVRDADGLATMETLPEPDGPLGSGAAPVYQYLFDTRGNLVHEVLPDNRAKLDVRRRVQPGDAVHRESLEIVTPSAVVPIAP